jgi:hypothetical protein
MFNQSERPLNPQEPVREAWTDNQCIDALVDALCSDRDCTIVDYLREEIEEALVENAGPISIAAATDVAACGELVRKITAKAVSSIVERFPEQLEDDLRISIEDEEYNRQLDAGEI